MHNREITYIVKTDSLSKTQLIVKTKILFAVSWKKLVKTKQINKVLWKHNEKASFGTLKIQITSP